MISSNTCSYLQASSKWVCTLILIRLTEGSVTSSAKRTKSITVTLTLPRANFQHFTASWAIDFMFPRTTLVLTTSFSYLQYAADVTGEHGLQQLSSLTLF